ncbi:MAG: 1-acyl-sn-glycerol-3-phosphate acyltransferase [Clostridia bacterium]|nr:1-acyl-sn-glycerol-3-phosphate acyltransferase [Clostridia bacterium]
MRKFTRFIKWLVCKFMYRVEYHHAERLDIYSTYLICPNHSNIFDPVIVFPAKYDLDIHIVAKKELFKYPFFKWLAKKYNIISIDRENVDVRSMLKSLDVFKQNENAKLIIFPEGKVVKDKDEIGKVYKKGAAFIASHINKPIIPVYITRRPKPFQKVHVIYGEPIIIDDIKGNSGNKMDNISKELINNIYDLQNEISK